jgi:chromosome segregation ATPase
VSKDINLLSEVGLFVAGVLAAGWLAGRRKEEFAPATAAPMPAPARAPESWNRAISDLDRRLTAQEAATAQRFAAVEAKIDEQATRLAELPSTQQIVGAMEQLISKTMGSLDDRLTNQAHSIEVLKTTVSQTDGLLERVLESLDSLQTYTEPLELSADPLKQAV